MALTHSVTRGYRTNAGTITSITASYTGSSEVSIEESVTTATEPTLVVGIDVSAIKSMMIHSTEAVTLKFNDDGSPTDTIEVAEDQIITWTEDDNESCPLTADVTSFDVVNASGQTAVVKLRVLMDATP
jgi:uncharacterized protein (DUF305 family)